MVLFVVEKEHVVGGVALNSVGNMSALEGPTNSSSESLSKAANIALTFEVGVNCVGEVAPDSLAGVESLVEAIVVVLYHVSRV